MVPPGSASNSCNDVTTPGRPRDERQRQRLQAQAAELLVARQSCEISLRDLADALETSSRMLVHHFGSRDALIAAPLARPCTARRAEPAGPPRPGQRAPRDRHRSRQPPLLLAL